MITVSLHGAEFFAYHGFYPEEQLLGNKFIIDIDVDFETDADLSADELSDTANYEQLYNIAKEEMAKTAKLLETVVHNIVKRIREEHPYLQNVRVVLKKLNPPLQGHVTYSAVTITDTK